MKEIRPIIIICATILLVAGIAALSFMNRTRTDDTISITGLGKVDFQSDQIIWAGSFTERDLNLEKAYDKINVSKAKLEAWLAGQKVNAKELTFAPVNIAKVYTDILNSDGARTGERFEGYDLTQVFEISSAEVDKISAVSRDCSELVKQGVELISEAPRYFYTKLADLKLKLVALATQDAKSRATEIAQNSGAGLGKLRSSSLGVFQIIGANDSPETSSWDGAFDTASRDKTATVTVRAYYEIR